MVEWISMAVAGLHAMATDRFLSLENFQRKDNIATTSVIESKMIENFFKIFILYFNAYYFRLIGNIQNRLWKIHPRMIRYIYVINSLHMNTCMHVKH